jgi:hypothetical protein
LTTNTFIGSTDSMFVVVIGRGSGGTRLASEMLQKSGVHMGSVNVSGDLVPADEMYRAARLAGQRVRWAGRHRWHFSGLVGSEPPPEYAEHVRRYLSSVTSYAYPGGAPRGFKLPETLLSFPWFVQLFPEAHYIHWTRDPRSALTRPHITDYLTDFGAPSEYVHTGPRHWPNTPLECRVESYLYQRYLVQATPQPRRFLEVRFEDFVVHHEPTVRSIATFLGMDLRPLPGSVLDRRKVRHEFTRFPADALRALGY